MEISGKKKDLLWWAVLVAIILWVVFKWPMFVFGIAIFFGVYKWLSFSPPKPAKTDEEEIIDLVDLVDGEEEAIKEHEEYLSEVNSIKEKKDNFNPAPPKSDRKEGDFVAESEKIDSFYSGISEGSSINDKAVG